VAAFDDSPVANTFLIYFQDAIIDQDQGRSCIIVYSIIVSVDERCRPSSRCPLGTTRKRDVMESATDNRRTRSDLFGPLRLGPYLLANRIVMAPLTRSRAGEDGVPRPLMAEYYAQRASAGLIIAEGTNISPEGRGYALTPGIYDDAQVEGWRQVTEAVHARGGRIFPQLWHVGRVSHPSLQPGGVLPVAPSAVRPQATSYTEAGFQACVTPRALATAEIPDIVEQYRHAARNALAAGFDGVEIHAANGYLIEQFLRDSTNKRTDAFGGSREKRARLL
jgi:N-ethylmaleimide reductase